MANADFNDIKNFLLKNTNWEKDTDSKTNGGNGNNVIEQWEFSKYVKENWGDGKWSGTESKSINNDIIAKFWNSFDTDKSYSSVKDAKGNTTNAKDYGALNQNELINLRQEVESLNKTEEEPKTSIEWGNTNFTATQNKFFNEVLPVTLNNNTGTPTYAIVEGELPTGMKLDNGAITGTTSETGAFTVSIKVSCDGIESQKDVKITVNEAEKEEYLQKPSIEWGNTNFTATQNQSFNKQLPVKIKNTDATPTYAIVGGKLPTGMELDNGAITGTTSQTGSFTVSIKVSCDGVESTGTVKIEVEEEEKVPVVNGPKYVYAGHTDTTGTAILDGYTISSISVTEGPAGSVGKNSDNGFTVTAPATGYTQIEYTITMQDEDGNEIKSAPQTVNIKQTKDIAESNALQINEKDTSEPLGGLNGYVWQSSLASAKSVAIRNIQEYVDSLATQIYTEADSNGYAYNMSAIRYAMTTTKNYFSALIGAVEDNLTSGKTVCNISSREFKDGKGNALYTGNTSYIQASKATKNGAIGLTDVSSSVCGIALMEERNNCTETVSNNMYKFVIDKADIKTKFIEFYNKYQNDPSTVYTSSDDLNPVTEEEKQYKYDEDGDGESDFEAQARIIESYNGVQLSDANGDDFMHNFMSFVNTYNLTTVVTSMGSEDNHNNDSYEGTHIFSIEIQYPDGYSYKAGTNAVTLTIYSESSDITEYFYSLIDNK